MSRKRPLKGLLLGIALVSVTALIAACGGGETPGAPGDGDTPEAATSTPMAQADTPTPEPTDEPTATAEPEGEATATAEPEGDATATAEPEGEVTATAEPTTPPPTPTTEPTGTQEQPGEGVTVQSARATWNTGWFTTEIYIGLLEELGYTVERPTTLDNPIFYTSVARGDVDFWVNGWFPLHNTYRQEFEQGAEIAGTVAAAGALEGYLVSREHVEQFDITSLEDFKRPEVKEAFDANGDGLADLVACPPGWGCELTIEHHLDAYELRDHVNPIKAGYQASMADAIARYEAGEPIFFYTWTPNWTVNELVPGEDVMWIEVPFSSLPPDQEQFEDDTTLEGVEGCVSDPCNMGFPANDINVVANTEFLQNNPAAATLFEVMSIPLEDIFAQNALMFQGEDSDEDIMRHAENWIEENRSTVDGWLQEARAAGSTASAGGAS